MLDRFTVTLIRPSVDAAARALASAHVKANSLTLIGFLVGVVAALLIAAHAYYAGAAAILASRTLDALDGAVARLTQPTDAGGFLDIALDFLFYAAIPLAFAFTNPADNALAAALLLAAFVGTSSSFLAFATLAAKRGITNLNYPNKSIYFLGGLTEATETLAFFIAMCLAPKYFPQLATLFSVMCAVTITTRVWWGWKTFS